MNLRNNILLAAFALGAITAGGCDSLIYDDYEDCPQGVYVNLYSQTPCAEQPTYPSVENLKVFAFNEAGVLVAEQEVKKPTLSADFQLYFPLPEGYYTFVSWTGLSNEVFDLPSLKIGKTTKRDLMLSIKNKQNEVLPQPKPGFQAYMGQSEIVFLPSTKKNGSTFERTKINLLEQTNRIKVSLIGVAHPERYDIRITSANGSMNVDGSIVSGSSELRYPSINDASSVDSTLISQFNTLKLQTGYKNKLVVYDKLEDKNIFVADLIGSILLGSGYGYYTNINMDCTHDFDVKLYVKDKCECEEYVFVSCEVNLIKWDIHSYSIDFSE